jgi:dCMP deaminase
MTVTDSVIPRPQIEPPTVTNKSDIVPKTTRLSWDEYFMSLALLSAKRSKDPQTQVGACIVSHDKKIVGIGYNGFPYLGPMSNDDCLPWGRGDKGINSKYPFVCHAEMNAVMNKNQQDISGCTIYTTLFPCNECAKILIQSGIREVVYMSDSKAGQPSMIASRKMFSAVGIVTREYLVGRVVVPLVGDDFSEECS